MIPHPLIQRLLPDWCFEESFQTKLQDAKGPARNLCAFTGDCESETMCEQTIHAACYWLKEQGMPASYATNNTFVSAPMQCVDNARGFAKLMKLGYFHEVRIPVEQYKETGIPYKPDCVIRSSCNIIVLIVPTEMLLDAVLARVSRKKAA